MPPKTVILLDGGFVREKLQSRLKRFPETADVVSFSHGLMKKDRLLSAELPRIHYYDAPPYAGTGTNPIDRTTTDFATTAQAKRCQKLPKADR